jgi:hypothetical protein
MNALAMKTDAKVYTNDFFKTSRLRTSRSLVLAESTLLAMERSINKLHNKIPNNRIEAAASRLFNHESDSPDLFYQP